MLLDSFEKYVQNAAQRLNERLRRHPRRVAAAVCTLLGGFAVTAFGIAPLAHPIEQIEDVALRLREDAVTETVDREANQRCAPATQDGLYLVPKVIE